jgi:hypothetical protein
MSIWWTKSGGTKRVIYSASFPWYLVMVAIGLIATFVVVLLGSLTR